MLQRPDDLLAEPGVAETLALFVPGRQLTRAEVAAVTGWARVTVTARVERLVAEGLLVVVEERAGARGRPAATYRLARDAGMLLVADVGATGMGVARCDLAGEVLQSDWRACRIEDGPDAVLAEVRAGWDALAAEVPGQRPWGVAAGLPGPVEQSSGRVVDPPIMTGWDGFDVSGTLGSWWGTPTHVENDANALALGEVAAAAGTGDPVSDLLVIKVGTGVGAGIVSGGRVLRGAAGAAGDLGHTEVEGPPDGERPLCRCGKTGCVEAYAGGWALVRDAAAAGRDVHDVEGFLALLAAGDPVARALSAQAGRVVGGAVATAVSLLNPERVLLGGSVGLVADQLVAGVRERVYARSLPLATRSLRIEASALGREAGVRGLSSELSRLVLLGPARPPS